MPGEEPLADFRPLTPGYFASMGVPVDAGRDLSWDDTAGSLPVVIISEAMARRFWPNEDPLADTSSRAYPTAKAPGSQSLA
jgi:putative ABC transport system permease protein